MKAFLVLSAAVCVLAHVLGASGAAMDMDFLQDKQASSSGSTSSGSGFSGSGLISSALGSAVGQIPGLGSSLSGPVSNLVRPVTSSLLGGLTNGLITRNGLGLLGANLGQLSPLQQLALLQRLSQKNQLELQQLGGFQQLGGLQHLGGLQQLGGLQHLGGLQPYLQELPLVPQYEYDVPLIFE